MDISPIIALICLTTSIYTAETGLEGMVFQNCNKGLGFRFMICRISDFEEYRKKS